MGSMQPLCVSPEVVSAFANCIMAIGAVLILVQIWQSKIQARTNFEDNLNSEYRRIIHSLPAKALLGGDLTKQEMTGKIDEFLTYVDLCNEQTFLRQHKRVGRDTWRFWADGMRSNLSRPAFKKAWETIKSNSPSDFQELRKLEMTDFNDDPADWA